MRTGIRAGAIAWWLAGAVAWAQSGNNGSLQVHGFATQSFLYSSANNYLGANTAGGTAGWNEAAVNIQDQVSEKLRVGLQLHYTRIGAFGGDTPSLDWALGDYTVKQWLGVRAGKVKIRWGLDNDTQDYDPGYLWSLLPEGMYGIDIRATNLSQLGAEAYGTVPLPKSLGKVEYSAYYGDYYYALHDGYAAQFAAEGLEFVSPAEGKTPGFDFRWATPGRGLKIGGSLMMYDAIGNLTNGSFYQPLAFWPAYYGQYEGKKVSLSYQYVKLVQYQTVTVTGSDPATSGADTRTWFATGAYRVTSKLQAGAYYTSYLVASGGDNSDPANYFHDWVVSSRYDFTANFYGKLEGHFMDGNAVGFYGFNNPNGLEPQTKLMVAKVGFTF